MSLEFWYKTAAKLRRHGRPDRNLLGDLIIPPVDPTPAPTGRDALVYGTYKPDATTTGVLPGTALVAWDKTPSTTNTYVLDSSHNGKTYQNVIVYGDLSVTATGDVTFINCSFVGGMHVPGTQSGVIDCNPARTGTGKLILKDCTISPRKRSLNRDCIVGRRYRIERCDLSGGIDGAGAFCESKNGTATNVDILGCFIHDLSYFYPDYGNGVSGSTLHPDGSHNDGIQIQGGANIWVKGNNIECTGRKMTGTHPTYPWVHDEGLAFGSDIIIQNNTTPLVNVVVEDNWFGKAMTQVNLKPGSYTLRNNHHTRWRARSNGRPGSWSGYYIRGDKKSTTTVTGISTNRWDDDDTLLAEPQTSGIHWNA